MDVITVDAHRISIEHRKTGHDAVVVLAHGFYNNKEAYLFRGIAEDLSRHFDVISFDFRGHGKSSGLFSWTSYEPRDLRAVMEYAKTCGYGKIGIMGFSLGAAIAIIECVRHKETASLIAVSTPTDFWKIDYHFWEKDMIDDLKLNLGAKGKGKGFKPGNPFLPKIKPIDVIAQVSPIPLLLVHGSEDWLVRPWHSERLYEKAKEPKKLAILKGMGHAERIYDARPKEFIHLCTEWFQQTLKNERGQT